MQRWGELIMSFALITAILTMAFALFGRPASGGDIVDCVEAPGSGRWVYRIIDERQSSWASTSWRGEAARGVALAKADNC